MADLLNSIYAQLGVVGLFICALGIVIYYQHKQNVRCHSEHREDIKDLADSFKEVVIDNTQVMTTLVELIKANKYNTLYLPKKNPSRLTGA